MDDRLITVEVKLFSKKALLVDVRHGDSLIGLNVVSANVDEMCARGRCAWCDGLMKRIQTMAVDSIMNLCS
mgnify:CR=1 FL=1